MSSAQLKKFESVKSAELVWRDGLPFSLEFNDVYFSVHGAVEESSHVFIQGNHLVDDWTSKKQPSFSIVELGFGSGLNFLNTASHWQTTFENRSYPSHIHYIAIEKRPIKREDLERIFKFWPQFKAISSQLFKDYPSLSYGRHQLHFIKQNISLTLMFMPVDDALNDLLEESQSQQNKVAIDHWYLDGFAPNNNSEMWSQDNAHKIAALSSIGSRLATYSVAGVVKAPLKAAGFKLIKRKGFAKKREMLTAKLENLQPSSDALRKGRHINIKYESPWFNLAQTSPKTDSHQSRKVAIIGAGLAGCSTAYHLSQQGVVCDLYDKGEQLACKASGAAAGIFHPQLTVDMNYNSQFNWTAYLYLLRTLSSFTQTEQQQILLSTGLERFLTDEKQATQLLSLAKTLGLEQWLIKSKSYQNIKRSVYFPHASVVDISAFCHLLIEKCTHQQLTIKLNTPVSEIAKDDQSWLVTSQGQTIIYDDVVYCGGANSALLKQFNILSDIPATTLRTSAENTGIISAQLLTQTNTTRGQTCLFESDILGKHIISTLCEQIYLVPQQQNRFLLGSTFEKHSDKNFADTQLNAESQAAILSKTAHFLKELGYEVTDTLAADLPLMGSVGYRLHSQDRLPIVGSVYDSNKLSQAFNNLGQTPVPRDSMTSYNHTGLWLNTGYGSHGLLYSLLASRHLSSLITQQVSPLTTQLSNAINPARFAIKQLRKSH
jgi:tRNA 5-methylaminomethyl-2-thiouridine biosynthesis bifunctional protein